MIPQGFAHGFLVLSDIAEFCYKCDDFYHANDEGGVAWNDPEIGIVWPGVKKGNNRSSKSENYSFDGINLILSDKDRQWPRMNQTANDRSMH